MRIQFSQEHQQSDILDLCGRVLKQLASRLPALIALSRDLLLGAAATLDILKDFNVDVAAAAEKILKLIGH
jgi:hypothetical protein